MCLSDREKYLKIVKRFSNGDIITFDHISIWEDAHVCQKERCSWKRYYCYVQRESTLNSEVSFEGKDDLYMISV